MNKTIATIALTGLLQVCAIGGLVAYLFNHANDTAYEYSLTAESNAVKQSREDILKMYQTLQDERNADREETHKWVIRQIALEFIKSNQSSGETKQ